MPNMINTPDRVRRAKSWLPCKGSYFSRILPQEQCSVLGVSTYVKLFCQNVQFPLSDHSFFNGFVPYRESFLGCSLSGGGNFPNAHRFFPVSVVESTRRLLGALLASSRPWWTKSHHNKWAVRLSKPLIPIFRVIQESLRTEPDTDFPFQKMQTVVLRWLASYCKNRQFLFSNFFPFRWKATAPDPPIAPTPERSAPPICFFLATTPS